MHRFVCHCAVFSAGDRVAARSCEEAGDRIGAAQATVEEQGSIHAGGGEPRNV